jgi:hypothetical protein
MFKAKVGFLSDRESNSLLPHDHLTIPVPSETSTLFERNLIGHSASISGNGRSRSSLSGDSRR